MSSRVDPLFTCKRKSRPRNKHPCRSPPEPRAHQVVEALWRAEPGSDERVGSWDVPFACAQKKNRPAKRRRRCCRAPVVVQMEGGVEGCEPLEASTWARYCGGQTGRGGKWAAVGGDALRFVGAQSAEQRRVLERERERFPVARAGRNRRLGGAGPCEGELNSIERTIARRRRAAVIIGSLSHLSASTVALCKSQNPARGREFDEIRARRWGTSGAWPRQAATAVVKFADKRSAGID